MQYFKITANNQLSKLANKLGLYDSEALIRFIQKTPYGRTSNRTDISLVFTENQGTCSSKHALIKAIATENNIQDLDLVIGMYKMSETNTPKIGNVLSENGLTYIPEAHCYLKHNNQQIDITTNDSDFEIIKNAIIEEIPIEPKQIGTFKVNYHKDFLKNWLNENNLSFSFEAIWAIREQCIANLSKKT
ncbi:MAG: hypothetical protein AB8G11_09190 [Saprospiraceae bacterium]